ncbi:Hsp20/alpha crystallin family protein [Paenibacillus sp. MMS18-CY102]|uniref:Hsp20/alpha crystallin family protein n=1 Tax=Paenibacillus sp. MMS18-CY102 TaxID=2682849 RepID=UPI003014B77D
MSRWDELERWMQEQQLPRGFEALKNTGWIERYVKTMMTKAMPEQMAQTVQASQQGHSRAETFETHHFIVVKWPLPQGAHPSSLRLLVREDRIRIEGLPSGEKETVKLPKPILPRVCKALCQDGILQVKLRKRPVNRQYYETTIRY